MADTTPQVSTLTNLYYATSLTGNRTQIGYVQSIPSFLTTKEEITYSALDMEDERMAKGHRKAEAMEIPVLYTEGMFDEIYTIADSEESVYWFIELPEATAETAGSPLVFYFTGSVDIGMDEISIDEMLQTTIKIYRDSAVQHSKGFPIE